MPGTKRPFQADLDSANGPDGDAVHPSRKRKVSEADAELSEIFNGLRDELPTVRTEATLNLMRKLAVKTPEQTQKINNAITRLIKGVCSSSKGARLGFSLALSEVLRLARKGEAKVSVGQMVEKVEALTRPSERDGKVSGEEKRNYAIGRRFAFQAILQSGALSEKTTEEEEARVVFDAVAELAAEKDWLRSECGLMLHEWLKAPGGEVKAGVLKALVEVWAAKGLVKTPEGVALWLTIRTGFEGFKLPKGHWHHNNPLSSQERAMLTKVLLKTADDSTEAAETEGAVKKKSAGTRDSIPSFAWSVVLAHLYEQNNGKEFAQFWEDCVAKPMFSASSKPERKFLGLQIFTKALASAPAELLGKVTHANIIRCILDQRVKPDRYLFEAAKPPLNQMASRAKSDPAAGAEIVRQVLTVLPAGPLDKLTKATIDSMLAVAAPLEPLVQTFHDLCLRPGVSDTSEAEKKRRMLADFMLEMVRTRRNDESKKWLKPLLKHLAELAYAEVEGDVSPKLTEASRGVFREKLMLALGHLMDLPLEQAVAHTSTVVDKLHSARKSLSNELDKDASSAIKAARAQIASAEAKKDADDDSANKVNLAFRLLLGLGILQVYKQEPESVSVLQDIVTCYSSPQDDGDASTMLVELLLSFVSKQSSLFRKLAEQVFAAFAPDVTAEALQSMIDILSQKESLAGQQELFKQGDEEEEEDDEDDDDDEASDVEMEDVDDASDVEIVNGVVASADNEASASASDSASDTSSPPSNEDEEAAFDRKLAAALGTAGIDNDAAASDSDGSDMDDDQMMALEPHLTTIFAERKKGSHTKQDNKDAKANIVNFKNRVLDLLGVYVKSQYASPLVLDLLHPLVTLTRTTGSQPTAKKACDLLVTLFNACKEHKSYPDAPAMLSTSTSESDSNAEEEAQGEEEGSDDEDTVEASPLYLILMAIHAEMMHGGSKVHATACSRTSQFLAKILIHQDPEHWTRVNAMYGELQARWRVDVGSKVQGSVFNDWHSFSMQRGGV
ncbi:unnamed protein product [Zymoseptoria tritici ST99CH_1A5]|uniref:DNA polymerase V n=1 Tax=Zymoseptoria tritici ST99CH_1A5 TaxID=1276529 RepID=A0A1Y6LNV4_ZYMTR|nr:unnamed protein product [Zymoseptoria tritici ST99CH_1A5]